MMVQHHILVYGVSNIYVDVIWRESLVNINTGCFIIGVTNSAYYIFQNMGRTFKWKSISIRRYIHNITSAGFLKYISLQRKGTVFQNDNMTSTLLQNDVQTFREVIDYGVARVHLKMYKSKKKKCRTKKREFVLCSPEHLKRNVFRQ